VNTAVLPPYGVIREQMRFHSAADVAAAIRGRRLDRGLSQAELANRSGVTRKWISEFESGTGASTSATSNMSATATVPPSASDLVDLDALTEEYRSR
jgi:transcriptional regulator with XRE-family HTH domain